MVSESSWRYVEFAYEDLYTVTHDDGTTETCTGQAVSAGYRFDVVGIFRDLWLGLVSNRYPACCVVAYTWWAFWHGAPALRYWQRHGFPQTVEDDPHAHVPCWRHHRKGRSA